MDNLTPTVVSLVPSISELICSLEAENQLIGVTKFCVRPAHLRKKKAVVGGTKKLRTEQIITLAPNLIVANKEENTQGEIAALSRSFDVLVTDVATLPEATGMILEVGERLRRRMSAERTVSAIKARYRTLGTWAALQPSCRVVYLIWQNPLMTVGGDTFVHEMLRLGNLKNVFGHRQRYPVVSLEEIEAARPDVIMLSSEPYPFGDKHATAFANRFPNSNVLLADGEAFSWYGSRLLPAAEYIQTFRTRVNDVLR